MREGMQDLTGGRSSLWGTWGWVLRLWNKKKWSRRCLPPHLREGRECRIEGKELPSEVQEVVKRGAATVFLKDTRGGPEAALSSVSI